MILKTFRAIFLLFHVFFIFFIRIGQYVDRKRQEEKWEREDGGLGSGRLCELGFKLGTPDLQWHTAHKASGANIQTYMI